MKKTELQLYQTIPVLLITCFSETKKVERNEANAQML